MTMVPDRVIAHVWSRIEVRGPDECWPASWSVASHGYTQIGWTEHGRRYCTTAHRVAWIGFYGPIPDDLTIDHGECRNHVCCNPRHLRLLPNIDNATDNGQGRKTHCPRRHAYDEENTYVDPEGHRRCRACRRMEKV